MSHFTESVTLLPFCGQQVNQDGVAFSPCTGCISRFSCRGSWSSPPPKKQPTSEVALPILLTQSDDHVTRLDPSHELVETREHDFCTIA
ncbi:hypothetical protein LOC68_20570 [Blastopirellula sp. JC732]|uniref:Uncharacterized protein n=1 Tax=Blastopirellula sediminis TaxID=2894196 RepID=A0A9X1MQZ4_9BACT|nr:hypothetical protein [Blastopirellula sediminis]MCC9605906.1 hypothetical protein [Blastopirellula sediminis]MCC9630795.1 hypothetical protein [Blastopirellula sediminis]